MKANEAIILAIDLVKDEFPGNLDQDLTVIMRDLAYENMLLAAADDIEERKRIEFNIATLETMLIIENAIQKAEMINFSKKLAMKALTLLIAHAIF
jgi:hypothetical protein